MRNTAGEPVGIGPRSSLDRWNDSWHCIFNRSGILSAKSSPFFNILVKRIWLDESQALAVSQARPMVRKSSHNYCLYSIGSL
jgi:hypothetical protein